MTSLPPLPTATEESEPSEPAQYVIPITPNVPISPPAFPNFDHNDPKYQCCCNHMHIALAARVVSVAYLCGAVLNVLLAVGTQGITLAFYSLGSFAFALAIFGTLIYGIFKEKRPFILPYMIFQVTSILCTAFIIAIFIVGTTFSDKMLRHLAADLGGLHAQDDVYFNSDMQMFGVIFIVVMVSLLFIQLWFLDIIYRFNEFIRDRESSFTLNLDSVLRDYDGVFSDFTVSDYEKQE